MTDMLMMPPPSKETHRAKRFRTLKVSTGYSAQFTQGDIEHIAETVDDWTTMLADTMGFPAREGARPAELSRGAKAALHDAAYYGTMTAVRQMSRSAKLSSRDDAPIGLLMASAAIYGAAFANSQFQQCRAMPTDKIQIDQLVESFVNDRSCLVVTDDPHPFDPEGKEQSAIDEMAAELKALSEELAQAKSEASSATSKLSSLQTRLERAEASHAAELEARDAEIARLREIVDASDERIEAERKRADEAVRSAEAHGKKAMIAKDEFLEKLKGINMVPDMSEPADNMWREVLVDGGFTRFRSASDVVSVCQMVYDRELAFSQKAVKDAEDYAGNPDEMWKLLVTLATVFLPSCRAGRPIESRAFEEQTGFGMSSNESKTTQSNKKMAKQRQGVVDGHVVTATHHAKGSSIKAGKTLRIYFDYDEASRKLRIVRCGDHLDTMGTKKRGY